MTLTMCLGVILGTSALHIHDIVHGLGFPTPFKSFLPHPTSNFADLVIIILWYFPTQTLSCLLSDYVSQILWYCTADCSNLAWLSDSKMFSWVTVVDQNVPNPVPQCKQFCLLSSNWGGKFCANCCMTTVWLLYMCFGPCNLNSSMGVSHTLNKSDTHRDKSTIKELPHFKRHPFKHTHPVCVLARLALHLVGIVPWLDWTSKGTDNPSFLWLCGG